MVLFVFSVTCRKVNHCVIFPKVLDPSRPRESLSLIICPWGLYLTHSLKSLNPLYPLSVPSLPGGWRNWGGYPVPLIGRAVKRIWGFRFVPPQLYKLGGYHSYSIYWSPPMLWFRGDISNRGCRLNNLCLNVSCSSLPLHMNKVLCDSFFLKKKNYNILEVKALWGLSILVL